VLEVRWSKRTQADVRCIADYWIENDPDLLSTVIRAIYQRVSWLADGHDHLGTPVPGLPQNYRVYRERRYGYKIYYRLEGTPPDQLAVPTIRYGRERPLSPSTVRRLVE
jgi:plasmid stabilization system protein ParE